MKVSILTTQTTHHTWYVQELCKQWPNCFVILEKNILSPKFSTYHSFEDERLDYEKEIFFRGQEVEISEITDTIIVDNINESTSISAIKKKKPDILITFGTKKINTELIDLFPNEIINLHGGDPEYYRGLDSHLWAIYHKDFENLVTTIHHLNCNLDDGRILMKKKIPIMRNLRLYQLRHINTQICLELTQEILTMKNIHGCLNSFPQQIKGRYYSFMPAALKEICLKQFEDHTKKL